MEGVTNFAPLFGAGGLVMAFFIYLYILSLPDGNEKMRDIAGQIHQGAMVYLRRQNSILVFFLAAIAILLWAFLGLPTALAYVSGGISSMLAGYFGMKGATKANVRTAEAANRHKPSMVEALFARVGGGIFTKTADVGADLVGKIEAGIPEDDPRNPGVIADNVGDNVGD